MSTHRVFIANLVFPRFSSTPARYRNFDARAGRVADLVRDYRCDTATLSECGFEQAQTLIRRLGWRYDRAQGSGRPGQPGEGMNVSAYNPHVFEHPKGRLSDYNMPSDGQWQRTLLLQRIVEKGDDAAFVGLTSGHSTLGNAGGLAYVKAMIDKIGDRRVIVGMDLKRTQDDDDLAALRRAGFKIHGRDDRTPMVCLIKGKVTVTDVEYVRDRAAFDHDALVVTYTLPNTPKDPA